MSYVESTLEFEKFIQTLFSRGFQAVTIRQMFEEAIHSAESDHTWRMNGD